MRKYFDVQTANIHKKTTNRNFHTKNFFINITKSKKKYINRVIWVTGHHQLQVQATVKIPKGVK
jgi:hypothetical protein